MTTQKIRNAVEQFIATTEYEYMYDDRDLMNVDLYRTAIIDEFVLFLAETRACSGLSWRAHLATNCTVETLDDFVGEWVAANLPPVEEEVE